MIAVLQRVTEGHVTVAGQVVGEIGPGLVILLGVQRGDTQQDGELLADKSAGLRIFSDEHGKMNRSVVDTGGAALVISQFTLCGDWRKGRRPGFDEAAPPDIARELYEDFCARLRGRGLMVATGEFGAAMQVHLINDGPVTFVLDSHLAMPRPVS